ncbi:MAG: bifunctional RNase H/acid phosphatase [Streptosporangiaceae bacterium]
MPSDPGADVGVGALRHLLVEADGGSRGNPGPAGYGAVVRDAESGELLDECAEGIGRSTNNVAEYRGLIAGLKAAAAVGGAAEVEVRMDSRLVVEQMSGRWKVRDAGLRPLAREAASVAASFRRVSYTWVPRARNTHADRLANEAMDAAARGRRWSRRAARETVAMPGSEERDDPDASKPSLGWAAPMAAPTATVLLRHGATPLSAERRFSGRGDVALNTLGTSQARAAGERLGGRAFDAVVSSPLRRAYDTAHVVAAALAMPVEVDEGLRETDFGAWEGFTFAEVRERWPDELAAWLADPGVAPPGGESFTETARRVEKSRETLLVRHQGETVLVVSHVTPIKMLVRAALEAPSSALYRLHLDPASLSEIGWHADGPAVVRLLNDTGHLR